MFKGHNYNVFFVDFSPDGRFLLSGSLDSPIRIWRIRDGSSMELLDTIMSLVTSVAISLDGRYVAAATNDGTLRIWDFRSRQLFQKWKAKGHDQPLWSVVFTPDGKGLLSGGFDGILRSWDISSLMANQSSSKRDGSNIDEEIGNLRFQKHTVGYSFTSFVL
jgi:glucose repression regulatory protein TUP1